ncbi:MAG: MDR family MFS transporter [Acidobacteriota bacterium]|nr:MDR family MFS transporter [Acidobacteriota bacterium]MDE2963032.1 MDR family MFS transporter [Acidobacteriota bacterium]
MNPESRHKAGAAPDPSAAGGSLQLSGKKLLLAMTGVMLAMFLAAVSQINIATAMPRIVVDLGGFDRYTWAATAYLVASAIAIPIAGGLADIFGRRIFFVLGLAIFMIGSIPAGLSQSMNQLIAFRAVMGVGGGILMANSFAAAADLFPPAERGRYIGLIGLVYGMSSVIGPPFAGFITDTLSWNWVFLMNVPAGIPVLWMLARTFPRIAPRVEKGKLDYPGMVVLTLAVASLMIALSRGGLHDQWASLQVGGLLGFGLAMALIFLVIQSKSDSPIMPLEIYGNRAVAVSVTVTVLTGFGLHSTALFTPLFFQGVLGSTATGSGGLLTPMMLGMVIGAIVSGRRLSRTGEGYRRQALISSAAMAVGIYLISTMNENTGFARAAAYVSLAGLGLGGAMSACNLAVQNSVPFRLVGSATSAIQFSRLFSGTVGLAVLGVVLTASFSSRLEETVSESVRAALAPGQFEAIKQNPRALVDPSAIDSLRAGFEERGLDGAQMADTFLEALSSALVGGLGDAFRLSALVVGLSFLAALFLRVEKWRG